MKRTWAMTFWGHMMMRLTVKKAVLTVCSVLLWPTLAYANNPTMDEMKNTLGFSPMLIHYSPSDAKGGVNVTITNHSDNVYLLKAGVKDMDPLTGRDKKTDTPAPTPLVITPPLARIEANGQYIFRVRDISHDLPKDRESAYIVSVTAIPATVSDTANQSTVSIEKTDNLQLALRMNIRLFYRPNDVPKRDNPSIANALKFFSDGQRLIVDNPTPYFVHLNEVSINNQTLVDDFFDGYISPKSKRVFLLDKPVAINGTLRWRFASETTVWHTAIAPI